jgi:hypothetical protein
MSNITAPPKFCTTTKKIATNLAGLNGLDGGIGT